MIVVWARLEFTAYQRFQIAYVTDVIEGGGSWTPRRATRAECRAWIEGERMNSDLHLGDLCPNFDDQGNIESVQE